MRTINQIIIHCSATPEGRDDSAADINRWNKDHGGIGYHYVIRLNGTIERGRPVEQIGAHCKGHNATSIGVCYIGGLRKKKSGVPDATCKGCGGESREPSRFAGSGRDSLRDLGFECADTRTEAQKAAMLTLVHSLQSAYHIPSSAIYGHREFANKACPCFDVKKEFGVPAATVNGCGGESGGIGRFNDRVAGSPCEPIAEREKKEVGI